MRTCLHLEGTLTRKRGNNGLAVKLGHPHRGAAANLPAQHTDTGCAPLYTVPTQQEHAGQLAPCAGQAYACRQRTGTIGP